MAAGPLGHRNVAASVIAVAAGSLTLDNMAAQGRGHATTSPGHGQAALARATRRRLGTAAFDFLRLTADG